MTALGMRLQLSRLRKSHGIAAPQPVTVPLAPPIARAQILSGYAATTTRDLQHQKFRGWAFGNVMRYAPPPLYFKHDQTREVGTIDSLSYDDQGALIITATVTDPLARRANAFSVGCTVVDYELVNADTRDFYALILHATLDEISLTDTPANPRAIVTNRMNTCAMAEFYGHAQQHVALVTKMIALIQKGTTNDLSPS